MSRRALFAAAGLLLLFAVLVYVTQARFTSLVPGANDFYSRYKGAQLFWQEGLDPYSDEASLAIQEGMYGRPALPDEDQVLFVYPFYTAILLLPLALPDLPYSWVQAIWLVTLQFAIVGAVVGCLALLRWRPRPLLMGVILLWTLLFYHSARTIILGQFAAIVFLLLVGCLLALQRGRDGTAGVLLALATIKPQMVFLAIPALLVWAVTRRRWRFIAAAAATMALLLGISFLLLPAWLAGFLEQVLYYPAYTFTGSPIWVVTGYFWPDLLGRPAEVTLSLLAVLYMLYAWRNLPRIAKVSDHLIVILGITFLVSNLILVRTATTNYIVLYLPLLWALRPLAARRPGLASLVLLLSVPALWALFLATIQGDIEHPIMYLPLPLLLLPILVAAERRCARATV